jgi:hypothetical protein
MNNKIENKKPWEVLLEGSPYSSELNFSMETDSYTQEGREWWNKMTPKDVINEVQGILDRYTPASGWIHAEMIEGEEGARVKAVAIKERNELRKVVAHLKKQYKRYYAN